MVGPPDLTDGCSMAERHRIHMYTGTGALCGAVHVLNWSVVHAAVTCPGCRAMMSMLGAERLRVEFESFFPAARSDQADGDGK
jgi:hypothetical protein